MVISMGMINELQKKVDILEGKLRVLNKQNRELKTSYDKSLSESLSQLNILKKTFEVERGKYLKLNEEVTPKCLSTVNYEDVLMDSIRRSEGFKQCCDCFTKGDLKNMSLSYQVKPKELQKQIEVLRGQGIITSDVETDNSDKESRQKVEESMKRKDKVKLNEVTGGYSYE
jgi:hypothetical protein